MKSSTSEARRPATRIRSSSSAVFRTTGIGLIMLDKTKDIGLIMLKFWAVSAGAGANFPPCSTRVLREEFWTAAQTQPLGERSVGDDASNAGSRGPFRTSDPVLEPEDGAFHLRPSQQDPHHQPRDDAGELP